LEQAAWWVKLRGNGGNVDEIHPVPHRIEYDDDARDRMQEHFDGIDERRIKETNIPAALWSRQTEKSAKLALIFAASRARNSIDFSVSLDDVNRSIKINNWITRKILRRVFEFVSENEQEAKVKKFMKVLSTKPMTLNELTRKTQWLKGRERNEILQDLMQSGMVVSEDKETQGRPAKTFRRIT